MNYRLDGGMKAGRCAAGSASSRQFGFDEGGGGGFGAGELADGALGGLEFHCRVVGDI